VELPDVWEKVSLRALARFGRAVYTDASGQVWFCSARAPRWLDAGQLSSGRCAVASQQHGAPAAHAASVTLCASAVLGMGYPKALKCITEVQTLQFTKPDTQQGAVCFPLCWAKPEHLSYLPKSWIPASSGQWHRLSQHGSLCCFCKLCCIRAPSNRTNTSADWLPQQCWQCWDTALLIFTALLLSLTYAAISRWCRRQSEILSWPGQGAFICPLLNSVVRSYTWKSPLASPS